VQKTLLDTQSKTKIERATEELKKWFITRLENHEHKATNFLIATKIESNIAISYKEGLIFTLCKLSNYVGKDFNNFTREDILSYLDSYRKTEAKDPLHSWIGSYNLHRVFIMKFFRWFYSPDMEPNDRSKPSCIENIPQLKRKEKSVYKPTDLWTPEDDLLFLKYCPSKSDRCYHAVSRDLSCRPHELLNHGKNP
jgi:hypothetical protein